MCRSITEAVGAYSSIREGDRGWPGDVPKSRLVSDKLARLGFRVHHSSEEAVARAAREVAAEVWASTQGEPSGLSLRPPPP